jgi:hypothetical protein
VPSHRFALTALLACGARTELEVTADASFGDVFTSDASDAPIAKVCPVDRTTVLVGDAGFGDGVLALDDGSIYWVSWNPIGIETIPKTGGSMAVVLSGLSGPVGLTASSGYVFWTDFNSNEVGRVSTDGGNPIVLAMNQSGAQGVAIADEVYWTTWKTGTADRVPIDGGTVQSLSNSTIVNYAEMTTDGQHVFWATSEVSTGSIMASSLAKQTVSVLATAPKEVRSRSRPMASTSTGKRSTYPARSTSSARASMAAHRPFSLLWRRMMQGCATRTRAARAKSRRMESTSTSRWMETLERY